MERCSYFIKDKALFGSFPTQKAVNTLEENGVRYFVDLTCVGERKTTPYKTKYNYIKYPITDRQAPRDWRSFAQLILKICSIISRLRSGELLYLHCKGGHGRSGVVVAAVLCHIYGIDPVQSLRKTSHYHSQRKEMREKWRKMGSPQTKKQKEFVMKFFRYLKFSKPYQEGYTMGMNNMSQHTVYIEGVGTFPNAYFAFQSFRDPTNTEYIRSLLRGEKVSNFTQRSDWDKVKINAMYTVLHCKFEQHTAIRDNLMNTGLRPLVKVSSDSFWGCGNNGSGRNILGKLLSRVRNKILFESMGN
jgi:ribA/ribD-fused uncharacterized protein